MFQYVLRRIIGAVPLVLAITIVVFFIVRLVPGDPVTAMLPPEATLVDIQHLREVYGLDKPILVQFWLWLVQLFHGNLGTSLMFHEPVVDVIARRFPATLELAVCAGLIGLVIGVLLGTAASIFHDKLIDRVASIVGLLGISAPTFWIGLMLIIYVAVPTQLFPTGGRMPSGASPDGPTRLNLVDTLLIGDWSGFGAALHYLILPAFTLSLATTGLLTRMTRSSMLDVLGDDYIRTARAKGAAPGAVYFGHALRNASRPIATVFGLEVAELLSGSIVIETIFAWPGIGSTLIDAVNSRDYPLIQGTVLVFALIFVLANLAVDIVYRILDPRIRY